VTLDEGNDAHRIISARYKAFHPAAFLDRELWEIAMAVNPGVSPLKLTKPIHYVLDLRPDIYDPPTNALYEIKPLGSEPLAFTKASMYVGLLHLAQVGAKFGPRNDPAVWGLAPFWGNSRSASAGRWLMWFSIFPGTISYEILNCKPRNAPKLVYVPVPVPAPASRWARTPPPVPNGGILDLIPNWGIENYNTAGMVFAAIGLAATGGVIVEAAPAVIPALVPALKQALKQALAPAGAGRWLTDG
jgi:hypothetical protein